MVLLIAQMCSGAMSNACSAAPIASEAEQCSDDGSRPAQPGLNVTGACALATRAALRRNSCSEGDMSGFVMGNNNHSG